MKILTLNSIKNKCMGFKFNSKWEALVYKMLNSVIPTEFLPIMVNDKIPGCRLELDFFIPKLKLAFELQGPTHVFFIKTIYNDLRKAAICKHRGIKLIYLDYKKHYSKRYFRSIFEKKQK